MRFTPLGGCGEFGLHSTLVEQDGEAVCIDAGLMFPDEDTPGVDFLVPDFCALGEARAGLLAYFLTHGHEDHVGALAFALEAAPAPIYGTPMTLALARSRLEELGRHKRVQLQPIAPGETVRAGGFAVTAVAVRHSVPGALGYLVGRAGARLFLSGDHKGLSGAAPEAVDVLCGDSTGALRAGRSADESDVQRALEPLVAAIPRERRIVIALFASNIERVQGVIDLAGRLGRTVGLVGRSLTEAADAARALGLLRPAAGILTKPARARIVIATGGQGEERAALARMAAGAHPDVALTPGDVVVLSGRPVPGNERAVARIADALVARSIEVIDRPELHASGHGSAEDLTDLLSAAAPRALVPVHGGARHLAAHAALARGLGIPAVVVKNGETHEIAGGALRKVGTRAVGVFAIENGARVPDPVLDARRAAGRAGVLFVSGERVTLAGISGVDADELSAAVRAGGPAAAARLVRRRTGKRPHVVIDE